MIFEFRLTFIIFPYRCPIALAPFVENTLFSPLFFVPSPKLIGYTCVCLISLFYFIFMSLQILHSLDYCSCKVSFSWVKWLFPLLFQNCFTYFSSFVFPFNFSMILFMSTNKCCWDFDNIIAMLLCFSFVHHLCHSGEFSMHLFFLAWFYFLFFISDHFWLIVEYSEFCIIGC